ncbi:MAG: hypothetical protein BGO09_05825 [Bacteroidetes bacterium 47-18]|nr:MAG: hypothetical protein BGO09_05825 [Bacteroidetes bacterium 47-18]
MKQHTTNYFNTLITVSEDCKYLQGTIPVDKPGKKTIAGYQYEQIAGHPFAYTSDDVLFDVYADRNDIPTGERKEERSRFFSKGQPCMRTSPLAKTYGWGIYSNAQGRVKLVDSASDEYRRLLQDDTVKKVPAMRSSRS